MAVLQFGESRIMIDEVVWAKLDPQTTADSRIRRRIFRAENPPKKYDIPRYWNISHDHQRNIMATRL